MPWHGLCQTAMLLGCSHHLGLQVPLLLLSLMIHSPATNLSARVLVIVDQYLHGLRRSSRATCSPRTPAAALPSCAGFCPTCQEGTEPSSSAAASCDSPAWLLSWKQSADSWRRRPVITCHPQIPPAAGPWIGGFLATVANTSLQSGMVFCAPADLHPFFCDFCLLHPFTLSPLMIELSPHSGHWQVGQHRSLSWALSKNVHFYKVTQRTQLSSRLLDSFSSTVVVLGTRLCYSAHGKRSRRAAVFLAAPWRQATRVH